MRVHFVLAHRYPRPFIAAMRDAVLKISEVRGDVTMTSALCAMEFNPVPSASDFETRKWLGHLAYAPEQQQGEICVVGLYERLA